MSVFSSSYISRNHLYTFMIASIAGLAAAVMPRLSAELVVYQRFGEEVRVSLFMPDAIWMIVVFSILVGLCATILMARHPVFDPPKIFWTALDIPALLSGSVSTIQSTTELESRQHVLESFLERVASMPPSRPIPTVPFNQLQPLFVAPESNAGDQLNDSGILDEIRLVKPTYAQERPNSAPIPEEFAEF